MAGGASRYTGGLPRWVYKALSPRFEPLTDFRGGLNLRDYPSNVAPDELGAAINIELNRDGRGVSALLGYDDGANLSLSAIPNGGTRSAIVSRLTNGVVIIQDAAGNFWRTTDFVTLTATMAGTPPAANAGPVQGVDFTGKIIVAAPTSGIFILDPATWTWSLATNAIKPEMLAVWQGKVWAIRDPAQPTRLWACNAGNAATWTTTTDWVDLRDTGDDPLTCVIATQEQDFQGRPSLLVYKRRSVHRVNSANAVTGFSYTTLATGVGAFGKNCAVVVQGRVISIDESGLWITDGVSVPVQGKGSDKVRPLFTNITSANLGSSPNGIGDESGICSVVRDSRAYFSIPNGVSINLTQLLAYDTLLDACTLVRWDDPDTPAVQYRYASMFAFYLQGNTPTYFLLRQGNTVVRRLFIAGPTGGLAGVKSRWQTGFYQPVGGNRVNIRRVRLFARLVDALTVTVYYDYDDSVVQATRTLAGDGSSAKPRPRDMWSFGKPRAISFRFDYQQNTSTLVWNGAGLLWNAVGLLWGRSQSSPACNVYGGDMQFSIGGDV